MEILTIRNTHIIDVLSNDFRNLKLVTLVKIQIEFPNDLSNSLRDSLREYIKYSVEEIILLNLISYCRQFEINKGDLKVFKRNLEEKVKKAIFENFKEVNCVIIEQAVVFTVKEFCIEKISFSDI